MGGPTGKTKDQILIQMLLTEEQGVRARIDDLAQALIKRKSTISEHISNLAVQKLVVEHPHLRGRWDLTPNGRTMARTLIPSPLGIAFRGIIPAGPPIRMIEHVEEYMFMPEYDPNTHFALRVRGTSMISFGIWDGDLVIMESVSSWIDVPHGAIIAARVPEGTEVEDDNWLDRLPTTIPDEGVHAPPLDHITLKQFDSSLSTYVSQGLEQQKAAIRLRGSKQTLYPLAVAVVGILVEHRRKWRW